MAIQGQVTWLCFAILSLVGLSLQQQADLRLEVEPRNKQFRPDTPVTLTCTLSDAAGGRVPIAGCGFRDYVSGAAWDIGTGTATINNTVEGEELSALITSNPKDDVGSCSLKITGLQWKIYMLGCRVNPVAGGGWIYGAMLAIVKNFLPQQYRLQPPEALVSLPGSDVTISGLAEDHVDVCAFFMTPTDTPIGLFSNDTTRNTTEYRHWREGRRCGVTLLNVQPSSSGFVRSYVGSDSTHRTAADFVELLVASPPVSPPHLSVNTTDAPYQAGDMLHATCVVGESLPVSNITWFLGGEVIREDNVNEAPVESAWRWNHEPQIILQRLSRRLTQLDDGKELKCRAGHLALQSGSLDSNSYIVHFGAKSPAGA